jgi:hypothetical protein
MTSRKCQFLIFNKIEHNQGLDFMVSFFFLITQILIAQKKMSNDTKHTHVCVLEDKEIGSVENKPLALLSQ